MKNLALYFAMGLWMYIIGQACTIQQADAVKFEAYSQHALELEQELKIDSEAQRILNEIKAGQDQSEALSKDSLQLALSILDSLQDVVLDDINISR